MHYLNLDPNSRGSSADAVSLFASPETARPAFSGSFDKHLQRPEPKPATAASPNERSERRGSPTPQTPSPTRQADTTPQKRNGPSSESPPAEDSSAPPQENSTPQGAGSTLGGAAQGNTTESASVDKQQPDGQQQVVEIIEEPAVDTPAIVPSLSAVKPDPEIVADTNRPADGRVQTTPTDKTRGGKKNPRGPAPRQPGIQEKPSNTGNRAAAARLAEEPKHEVTAKREPANPAERPAKEKRSSETTPVPLLDAAPPVEKSESVSVTEPAPSAISVVVESSPFVVGERSERVGDQGAGEPIRQIPVVQNPLEQAKPELETVPQPRASSRNNRLRPTASSVTLPGSQASGQDHSSPAAPASPSAEQPAINAAVAELESAPTSRIESTNEFSPTPASPPGTTPVAPSLRFAQHLTARTGERSAKASHLSDLERVRLVDRVARAFQAAEERGGTVTLRLHPPELGSVRVELSVTDGLLSAKLEAETPTARSALLENVQLLHDRLAEQGVRIERFDVDLLDHRAPGDAPAFAHNQRHDQEARRQPANTPGAGDQLEQDPRPATQPRGPGQLNVVV